MNNLEYFYQAWINLAIANIELYTMVIIPVLTRL